MKIFQEKPYFSFMLDEKAAWELPYTVSKQQKDDVTLTTYSFQNGLVVHHTLHYYPDFGAYEWLNEWENTASTPTGILSHILDCDLTLPMEKEAPRKWEAYFPDPDKATKVYNPTGSNWDTLEFYCDIDHLRENGRPNHILVGETKHYSCTGGRSSQGLAPFFDITKNGQGYIMAIGWTGQWQCAISRAEESVTLRCGLEDTHFRLLPGEKLRTASVVLLPYQNGIEQGHNQWRRLVRQHFSLIGQSGRDEYGPLCANIWGGMSSASVLSRVEKIRENDFPFDYIWMDAGWYGIDVTPSPDEFEGHWGDYNGDWRISPLIHPNGLKDVSKAVHDSGKKFLLWFEMERAVPHAPAVAEHPDYFLRVEEKTAPALLDLGNEDAWNYCFSTLCALIEQCGIDGYRQDFNMDPLVFWRKHDTPDRQGVTEIKHIMGMYRLWDALLARFPHLLIDNCASGGRRIDIETLRRSIPLWRSDFQCPANSDVEALQCHEQGFGFWMPYSGTSGGRLYDMYRMRSGYAPALATNFTYSERESFCDTPEKKAFVEHMLQEYKKVRPYLSEDMYSLTEISTAKDIWCAIQYDRPQKEDGLLRVFRRDRSPYETACFFLRGIKSECSYEFTDADGGSFAVDGKTLKEQGLRLTVATPRTAKLYFYRVIN